MLAQTSLVGPRLGKDLHQEEAVVLGEGFLPLTQIKKGRKREIVGKCKSLLQQMVNTLLCSIAGFIKVESCMCREKSAISKI